MIKAGSVSHVKKHPVLMTVPTTEFASKENVSVVKASMVTHA